MKSNQDTLKRHGENQTDSVNDVRKEVFFYNDIFANPLEKSLIVYARKIEKITTALYLVTDVMEPELPLTQSLRFESLGLLNACFQLMTRPSKINPSDLTQVMVRLEHVISLISIGRIAHHISEMNAQVLIVELEKVAQFLGDDARALSKKYTSYLQPRIEPKDAQPVLSHALLDDSAFDELERKRIKDTKDTKDRSEKIGEKKTLLQNIGTNRPEKNSEKIPVTMSPSSSINDTQIAKVSNKTTSQNDQRKQAIMNVIRSHKNASMQDIARFVTGCSEKTLQREIVSLIQAGTIRKIGDKRWATYHTV